MRTHDGVLSVDVALEHHDDGTIDMMCTRCSAVIVRFTPQETRAIDGLTMVALHELTAHWAVSLMKAHAAGDVKILRRPS